jgi:hypothetical protein
MVLVRDDPLVMYRTAKRGVETAKCWRNFDFQVNLFFSEY